MPSDPASSESQSEPQGPLFTDLGLSEDLLSTLGRMGFETPTEIQALAIPPLLEGRDIIGQARTGTGKTAAFALPLLQNLDLSRSEVQAVVLAPTRELALQVSQAMRSFAQGNRAIRVCSVYGGQSIGLQIRELKRGAHVVVGTPGRMIDLLERKVLRLDGLDRVVLDEADEMLRMGFIDDIETIFKRMPPERKRQTALFSATMAKPIRRIADKYLNDPVDAKVKSSGLAGADIRQELVLVRDQYKAQVLDRLLEVESYESALVFARTKIGCAELAEWLEQRGHRVAPLHGDMSQAQREGVLQRFRAGRIRLVVATDVAARGLDVDTISHVINFDLPGDADTYVHRIGRTGRAGRKGVTITMARPQDRQRIAWIERHTGQRMHRRDRPTSEHVNEGRAKQFKAALTTILAEEELDDYLPHLQSMIDEGVDPLRLAAAVTHLATANRPLKVDGHSKIDVVPFQITAGRRSRVSPRDIFGLLSNEGGIPREAIASIDVRAQHSEVWIASSHAALLQENLQTSRLRGYTVAIRVEDCRERINMPRQNNRPSNGSGSDYRGKPRSSGVQSSRHPAKPRKPAKQHPPYRVRVDEGGWMSFDGGGDGSSAGRRSAKSNRRSNGSKPSGAPPRSRS